MKAFKARDGVVRASLLGSVAMTALLFPGVVLAQADPEKEQLREDIVVTGTLIRGIAPAGSSVVGITEEEAKATGAVTTNQLLSNLPQSGFFNSVPVGVSPVAGSNGTNPIARPNLRNLPASNTSGSAQTLVMLDGHRVVPLGTSQLAVDPDFISPLVIQRVEAMTDGGSAVYGSDALGGVLNFITRERFDGVQVTANYGIGDNYKTLDVGGIIGRDWGSGSAYLSYRFAKSDAIFGADRDYARRVDPLTGIPTGRNCAAGPNVTVGTTGYVLSGSSLVAGAPVTCDYSDDVAIIPRLKSHNVFGSLVQDLTENLRFDMKFYFARRETDGANGTLGNGQLGTGAESLVTLLPTNPNYRPLPVGDPNFGLPQTVRFSLAPALGARSATQETNLETFNVTPGVTIGLGSDWQARLLFTYGYGNVDFRNAQVNNPRGAGPLALLAANGSLNPYNVSPTVAAALVAYEVGIGRNEYFNYRAVVDGPLFALPAGDVRVAFGAEYGRDNFQRQSTNLNTYGLLAPVKYTQTVKSLFGEVQVPVLDSDSGMKLDLSVSGRYDKYSDFGDTFNPKIGVTFKPFESLTLRGSWGKSFTAPSPADQLGVSASVAQPIPAAFLQFPPPTAGRCGVAGLPSCSATGVAGVFINGAVPGLQPQKSKSWSVGFDFKPVDQVYLSASYYRIDLDGTLGRPVTGAILTDFYTGYPDLWIFQPSGQQVAAVLASVPPSGVSVAVTNPTSTSQALVNLGGAAPVPVQVLLDTRVQSLGKHRLEGIDFAAGFDFPTNFGSIDGKVAGNYRLKQDLLSRPGLPKIDQLEFDVVKYVVSTSLGTTIGNFRAQATWNHTPSYKRSANPAGQTRVAAFDVVNLYFKYDFAGEGIGKELSLSLNVNNVFDEDPSPFLDAGQPGFNPTNGQGFTLGRIFQVGLTKKF